MPSAAPATVGKGVGRSNASAPTAGPGATAAVDEGADRMDTGAPPAAPAAVGEGAEGMDTCAPPAAPAAVGKGAGQRDASTPTVGLYLPAG